MSRRKQTPSTTPAQRACVAPPSDATCGCGAPAQNTHAAERRPAPEAGRPSPTPPAITPYTPPRRTDFDDQRFKPRNTNQSHIGQRPRHIGRMGHGFSMIELLIALSISGMLLSACLVALDASFKSYEVTSESASTHVVSRMVMYRALAMIRSGEQFGPYPLGVLVPTKITSDYVEFLSLEDEATGTRHITRLEKVPDGAVGNGFYQLMYKRWEYVGNDPPTFLEYPLIKNLRAATFTLEYDRGPKLRRATIDLTIKPDDIEATAIESTLDAPVIRLIASTSPRRLD